MLTEEDERKWYPKNLQYNPACSICRDLAKKDRACVEDWQLCIVHLREEYDRMKERIKVLEDALRPMLEVCKDPKSYDLVRVSEIISKTLEGKP